jgi:hypothetical protein
VKCFRLSLLSIISGSGMGRGTGPWFHLHFTGQYKESDSKNSLCKHGPPAKAIFLKYFNLACWNEQQQEKGEMWALI